MLRRSPHGADGRVVSIALTKTGADLLKATFPVVESHDVAFSRAEFLSVQDYKNLQRWADALLKRPAVRRGRMVNRISGEPAA